MTQEREVDPELMFTVASVWREERVSCPHPDILQSWSSGSLEGGAADFIAFHVGESQCPYCNAVLADLAARDSDAQRAEMAGLRDRLLRSTAVELRRNRA